MPHEYVPRLTARPPQWRSPPVAEGECERRRKEEKRNSTNVRSGHKVCVEDLLLFDDPESHRPPALTEHIAARHHMNF